MIKKMKIFFLRLHFSFKKPTLHRDSFTIRVGKPWNRVTYDIPFPITKDKMEQFEHEKLIYPKNVKKVYKKLGYLS